MESLHPGLWIHIDVLYAWSAVLNNEERYRQKGSVARLFCMPLMLNSSDYAASAEVREEKFTKNMETVLMGAESNALKDYRMVFIPIIYEKHYYLITVDLLTCESFVIDNSAVDVVEFTDKYNGWPEKIVHALSGYLKTVKHPSCHRLVKSKPIRLQFPWRTVINSVDCGVFLMRHMETYKGTAVKDWACGLSNEKNEKGEWSNKQRSELTELRKKYVSKILLSEINKSKHVVEMEVAKYGKLSENYKKKLESTALGRISARLDNL